MTRVALALALGAVACGPERLERTESDLRTAIAAAVGRGDTATIRLFTEVPFAFDAVFIAGPRTPADSLARVMGSAWEPRFSRGLETDDRFHLLVFVVRNQLVPATLPRSVAEIAPELTGRLYAPETAVFRVRQAPGAAVPSLLPR
ncbi:MAG: hypothetical protein IPJ78_10545 [Gemmatimonadetes bacterium]|nr:hypothetical protein [Gemmatimonadota bacterium]